MRVNYLYYFGVFIVVWCFACMVCTHADSDSASDGIDRSKNQTSIKQSNSGTITTDHFQLLLEQGDFEHLLHKTQDYLLSYDSENLDFDVVTYFAAVSHYHMGNHRAAHNLLYSFSSKFPSSLYLENAQFYSASNLIKMHWWRAGSLALDSFIKNFPDSAHLADAYYDRASADYFFKDYNSCLNFIITLERINNDPHLELRIKLLKGYALKGLGRLAESEGAFLIAKNKAKLLGSSHSIARSLLNLIEVSADQGRWRDSSSYYYIFMNDFKDSIYAINAAVAGISIMEQMGKEDEAMERFEEILFNASDSINIQYLNEALLKYSTFIQERYGTSTILVHLGNLLGRCECSESVREVLILARLEILEAHIPENDQEIEVYYREIMNEFDYELLSDPALLKLAFYYRQNEPSLANKLYREVFDRGSSRYESEAIFGMAKIHASSSDEAELRSSILGFRQAVEIYGDVKLKAESLSELDKLLVSYQELSDSEEILMSRSKLIAIKSKPRRTANRKMPRKRP